MDPSPSTCCRSKSGSRSSNIRDETQKSTLKALHHGIRGIQSNREGSIRSVKCRLGSRHQRDKEDQRNTSESFNQPSYLTGYIDQVLRGIAEFTTFSACRKRSLSSQSNPRTDGETSCGLLSHEATMCVP